MEKKQQLLLIAGGGTGGHLFPGLAVAEEFLRRSADHQVVFLGTSRGIEARRVPEAGYPFVVIRSRGLARMSWPDKLQGAMLLPLSLWDAFRALRRLRPRLALGVGGFVSGPALLAAWLLDIPCAILEQNAVPGWTNRLLAGFADLIFISFPQSRAWFARADRGGRVVLTGNPVRRRIVEFIRNEGERKADNSVFRLLVVGGSQGAHGLNLLMVEAAAALPEEIRKRVYLRHQTGTSDADFVRQRYQELGIKAAVEGFIEDMAAPYREADVIISRAGAGAVAEIALAGCPAIFIPYPYAAGDHQSKNASALVEAGAALMFRQAEIDGRTLATVLTELLENPERRRQMAAAARAQARPEAAAVIVDHCLELMKAAAS